MLQNLEDLKRLSESAWIYLNLQNVWSILDLRYGLMDNRPIYIGARRYGQGAPVPSGNDCFCALQNAQ